MGRKEHSLLQQINVEGMAQLENHHFVSLSNHWFSQEASTNIKTSVLATKAGWGPEFKHTQEYLPTNYLLIIRGEIVTL